MPSSARQTLTAWKSGRGTWRRWARRLAKRFQFRSALLKAFFFAWICYNIAVILVYNSSAFKHGFTESDIETAMATALVDELMLGFDNKYLVVGFDRSQNLIEVIYNLVDEDRWQRLPCDAMPERVLGKNYGSEVIMPILTDDEANALDELLTKTTVETNPNVQGPFIKNRERVIVLDAFSAEYLKSQMITTNKTPAQLINGMIHREMARTASQAARN